MNTKRKTIDVEVVKKIANDYPQESKTNPEVRVGVCVMIERILFATGNYHGYWQLRPEQVPVGEKAGIIFDESSEHKHTYPDESRRMYY